MKEVHSVNSAGAEIYKDPNDHDLLEIPVINEEFEGEIYTVLSAGFCHKEELAAVSMESIVTVPVLIPLVTIKNDDGIIQAYRLPEELADWVRMVIDVSTQGTSPFPHDVAFGLIKNKYYVEFK
ncbi:hypothetical protein V7183_10860 [Bacillus sp. JJ1127]|uniref:hypothetical protein n=1 Tax=Bacillus sp. JJ1127 TaxID=3122952 RepID=UPI00300072B6